MKMHSLFLERIVEGNFQNLFIPLATFTVLTCAWCLNAESKLLGLYRILVDLVMKPTMFNCSTHMRNKFDDIETPQLPFL
jgi:hypothetical protein